MSEERSESVIDILRTRLGSRHQSTLEGGRADIVRVLSDELSMERDRAEQMVARMIESGQLRYVTGDERDPEADRDAQYDKHTGRANQVGGDAGYRGTAGTAGPDDVPLAGGPLPGSIGGIAVPTAGIPAAAGGAGLGGAPLISPLPAGATGRDATDRGASGLSGYWDIGGGAAGVVPSPHRKGQVEPRGT